LVLLYPPIDPQAQTSSRAEYASGPYLSTAAADAMWNAYLGSPANAASSLAVPSRAVTLRGLPPTLILTAACDPLRDEGEDYGRQLRDAGVPTTVQRVDGVIHGTFSMSGVVPRSGEFYDAITMFVRSLRAPALHA
ncbi:MAG: alpha/beta hydrolase fold domain-containing protein, partial [Trebonia sp.]